MVLCVVWRLFVGLKYRPTAFNLRKAAMACAWRVWKPRMKTEAPVCFILGWRLGHSFQ